MYIPVLLIEDLEVCLIGEGSCGHCVSRFRWYGDLWGLMVVISDRGLVVQGCWSMVVTQYEAFCDLVVRLKLNVRD